MKTDNQPSQSCICCLGTTPAPHFPGLLRCAACGHIWADLRLSEERLRALYSQNYFQGGEYVDYERESPALCRNFRRQVHALRRRHAKGARLWEVGAAYGFFLREAAPFFSVAGCDISEHAAAYAQENSGVDVTCGNYLHIALDSAQDIVCLWDTVEHLSAPEQYLAKAASDLRTGGTLALSTGDIGSIFARVRGPKWRLLHPPTHLHYFTVKSMRSLLLRLGFVDVRIRHLAFWRSANTVAARLLSPSSRLFNVLQRRHFLDFPFPVNTFDLMTVYALRGDEERAPSASNSAGS